MNLPPHRMFGVVLRFEEIIDGLQASPGEAEDKDTAATLVLLTIADYEIESETKH